MTVTDRTAPSAGRAEASPEERSLRERKKQQTRRAIHEAALRLVEANGLDGVTIEQICAAADVSPRTFFNYFPSKPAAALGLPEQVFGEESVARFHAADGGLVAALCAMLGDAFTHSGAERKRIKALVTARPELQPAFGQWMTALRTQIVEIAETRADTPEDAHLAIALVMAALSTLVHNAESTETPNEERLRAIVRRLGEIAREG